MVVNEVSPSTSLKCHSSVSDARMANKQFRVVQKLSRRARRKKEQTDQLFTQQKGRFAMGYCLYITRADNWLDAKNKPITEEEWLAAVAKDPTLSVNEKDFYEYKLDGGRIKRINPVEWSEAIDGNCFWWQQGAIECKNPSEVWISKMVKLAKDLNAKVLGEANEEFT